MFINGAMEGPAFATHARDVLITEIKPSALIDLDRFPIYCNTEAVTTLREHGFWFLYLPPYSPNINPIEIAFSKLKPHLSRISASSFKDVFDAIAQVCNLFGLLECSYYFSAAGYTSNICRNALIYGFVQTDIGPESVVGKIVCTRMEFLQAFTKLSMVSVILR